MPAKKGNKYAVGNLGGRPPKYSKKILIKTREYIDSCVDEEKQIVRQANSEKGYEMYDYKLKVNLPTIEGLALYLGIVKSTVFDWEKKYEEFSNLVEELRAKQAKVLLENGLSGEYNSTITKLILSKHGYREQLEQEVNVNVSLSHVLTQLDERKRLNGQIREIPTESNQVHNGYLESGSTASQEGI